MSISSRPLSPEIIGICVCLIPWLQSCDWLKCVYTGEVGAANTIGGCSSGFGYPDVTTNERGLLRLSSFHRRKAFPSRKWSFIEFHTFECVKCLLNSSHRRIYRSHYFMFPVSVLQNIGDFILEMIVYRTETLHCWSTCVMFWQVTCFWRPGLNETMVTSDTLWNRHVTLLVHDFLNCEQFSSKTESVSSNLCELLQEPVFEQWFCAIYWRESVRDKSPRRSTKAEEGRVMDCVEPRLVHCQQHNCCFVVMLLYRQWTDIENGYKHFAS